MASTSDYYVVIDTETGGLNPAVSEVLQLSGIKIMASTGAVTEEFDRLMRPSPDRTITPDALKVNGLSADELMRAPLRSEVYPEFLKFVEGCPILGYNLGFDLRFIRGDLKRLGLDGEFPKQTTLDILPSIRKLKLPTVNNKLSTICEHLGYKTRFHDALHDCRATDFVFRKLILESRH